MMCITRLYYSSGLTMKSILYFDKDDKGIYTGEQAVSRYIENDAEGRSRSPQKAFLTGPKSTENSIKLMIWWLLY